MAEDAEGFEQTEDLGIPQDTPDEITDFVKRWGVADKFSVLLKRLADGRPNTVTGILDTVYNQYPQVKTVGERFGSGEYELVFSWRARGKSGKMETETQSFKFSLPADPWDEVHDDWFEAKQKKRRAEKEKEWEMEAAKKRAQGGSVEKEPAPSELDALKKALGMAKDLGIPIGGKQDKQPERKSFSQTMLEMVPAITALGAIVSPIAVALISRVRPAQDKSTENILLQHLLTQKPAGENETMKQFVPFLMGTMKQVFEMKEAMQPEEKQGWVEKIFDKLAPMVPAVLAMASQPQAQRDANPMLKMAQNHPDMRTIQGDEDLRAMSVQKLDETYGYQQANQILTVLGIPRPPEMTENYRRFPSQGWRHDGTHESTAPVNDGRSVPLPDESPEGGEDETTEG